MDSERLVPHDSDAEMAVLGSILLDNDTLVGIATSLRDSDFFEEEHRLIYKTCLELHEAGEAINQVTLSRLLLDAGTLEQVGGASYLSNLMLQTPTSLHANYYAKMVSDMAAKRMLITASGQLAKIGFDPDIPIGDGLDQAEDVIMSIRGKLARTVSRRIKLEALRKVDTRPPSYEAVINGVKFKFSAGELMSYKKVASRIMEELDFVPRFEKEDKWAETVNTFLQSIKKSKAPLAASLQAEIKLCIKRGLQRRREGTEYEDVASGCYIERQHQGKLYWFFQPQFVIKWLKRDIGRNFTHPRLWSIMEDWGAVAVNIELGNSDKKKVILWGLPPDFADKEEFAQEEDGGIPEWL